MASMFSGCLRLGAIHAGEGLLWRDTAEDMFSLCPADGFDFGEMQVGAYLMEDPGQEYEDEEGVHYLGTVFSSGIERSLVRTVEFSADLSGAPEDAMDVSNDGSGRVLAWLSERDGAYDLTIAADGGVRAGRSLEALFKGYTNLESVHFNGALDTSACESMFGLFDGCHCLRDLDFDLNTSRVTSMDLMFRYCYALPQLPVWMDTSSARGMCALFEGCRSATEIDLSGFDTSHVTDFSFMFSDCSGLTSLDISPLDTSSAEQMGWMFQGCSGLKRLDLSGFRTRSATDMQSMFENCASLEEVDLSSFQTVNVINMQHMFGNCPQLTELDLRSFSARSLESAQNMFFGSEGLRIIRAGELMLPAEELPGIFDNCPASGFYVNNDHVLMEDSVPDEPLEEGGILYGGTVLGSEIARADVRSVRFADTLEGMPEGSWDVSANGSGCVLAWVEESGGMYDLTIASEGGVIAPSSINSLFKGYIGVQSIEFNGAFDTSRTEDMGWLFDGCERLASIDFDLDTSNLVEAYGMFRSCSALEGVRMTLRSERYMDSIGWMFQGCSSLTWVDLTGMDTSRVSVMEGMFESCTALTELDLTALETSTVVSMNEMFQNCENLRRLNLSSFDTSRVGNFENMFSNTPLLHQLDLGDRFDISEEASTDGMFDGCASGPRACSLRSAWEGDGLLGTAVARDSVRSVRFADSIEGLEGNTVEVADGGEDVLMEFTYGEDGLCDVVIAAEGGVVGLNLGDLFSDCVNLERVDFGGCLDTSDVRYMSNMFRNCARLTELDLSGFETVSCRSFHGMFEGCTRLERIIVSDGFLPGEGLADAFEGCPARIQNADRPELGAQAGGTWARRWESGRVMQLWDSSESALALNARLAERGLLAEEGVINGYGEETRAAVAEFQQRAGLAIDGVADPLTQQALRCWVLPGDRGDAVRALQQALIDRGYLDGGADGIFGDGTEGAVSDFQRENGIPDTGICDWRTLWALRLN